MGNRDDVIRLERAKQQGFSTGYEGLPKEPPKRYKYGAESWHYWNDGYDNGRKRRRKDDKDDREIEEPGK